MFEVKKNTENMNPRISETMLLSNCSACSSKKSRFIKEQEASGSFSNLGIKTPLSKIPLLGNILF